MAGPAARAHIVSDGTANSVSLLISILVRYPEIATVNFVPEGKILKFTFMLSKPLSADLWGAFEKRLVESVQGYAALVHGEEPMLQVERRDHAEVSLVEISRDIDTLTQEEISLIIELARTELGSSLVTEDPIPDSVLDEELLLQDEMIENMLEDLKESILQRKLIGFREEGRVFVFNKKTERTKS
ncbi:MAG: hypothetical protein AB1700_03370 [Bacillota bacterium]